MSFKHLPYLGYLRVGLSVLKRRWAGALAAFLVPIVIVAVYLITAPPQFRATASVILEAAPGNEGLAFMKQPYVTSTDLANEIERVKSDDVLKAATELAAGMSEEELAGPPPSTRELACGLSVSELKGTDIFNVSVVAYDRKRAATLANLVVDSYIASHVLARREEARAVKSFIEAQVSEYESRLFASERAVEKLKETTGTVKLDTETEKLIGRSAEFDKRAEENAVELAGKRSRLTYLERELEMFRKGLESDRVNTSTPLAEELEKKLVALEYRYTSLLLKGYPPDHEELVALAQDIELARERLAAEMENVLDDGWTLDPFNRIKKIGEEAAAVRVDIAELEAREATLARVRAELSSGLKALPRRETELANLTREERANEEIYLMLLTKREEARIAEAEVIGNARVFTRATPPDVPISPAKKQSIFLGILSGIFLSIGTVLLLEYADRTIRTPGGASAAVSAPVLGVIPCEPKVLAFKFNGRRLAVPGADGNGARPVILRAPRSAAADAFRGLRVRFQHRMKNLSGAGNVVAVTSATPEEGKTTVAVNLAVALAASHEKVCLVDGDLNRPMVGEFFGAAVKAGLADVLKGEAAVEDALIPDVIPNLSIIPGKARQKGLDDLGGNGVLPEVVGKLRRDGFDYVIFDAAPIIPVADTLNIAELLDGYLFVVRVGRIDPPGVSYCEEVIKQVGSVIVGWVLNQVLPEDLFGGRSYYYYGHYAYGEERSADVDACDGERPLG